MERERALGAPDAPSTGQGHIQLMKVAERAGGGGGCCH